MTRESEFDEERHENEDVSPLFWPHVMKRRARKILQEREIYGPLHILWAEHLLGDDVEMAREAKRLGPAFMRVTAERDTDDPPKETNMTERRKYSDLNPVFPNDVSPIHAVYERADVVLQSAHGTLKDQLLLVRDRPEMHLDRKILASMLELLLARVLQARRELTPLLDLGGAAADQPEGNGT